jgi:hypothetical protein
MWSTVAARLGVVFGAPQYHSQAAGPGPAFTSQNTLDGADLPFAHWSDGLSH